MGDSWDQARAHVMHEIERNAENIEAMEIKLHDLSIEQARQVVKQGLWGAIGSSLPVIAYFLYQLLQNKGG